MKIEFVLGRVTAALEEYIYDQIAAEAQKDVLCNVLLIVPPQATYNTETAIIRRLRSAGIMGVSVLSMTKLADRILTEVRGAKHPALTSAGKSMVIRRILDENIGSFSALQKSAGDAQMGLAIAELISELKTLDITPSMLQSFRSGQPAADAKFQDIAFLYDAFEQQTEGLFDHEDKVNFVIDQIPQAAFLQDAHVYIHGFDIYNAQTVRFLGELMKAAKNTTMSFLHTKTGSADEELYEVCAYNHQKFIPLAKQLGLRTTFIDQPKDCSSDLLFLADNLYAYPSKHKDEASDISITYADTIEQEVRSVAAQIGYLTQKAGYEFRDIGIVCGGVETYSNAFRNVFERANIPYFMGERRTISQSSFSAFLLSALRLCRGRLKKSDLLAHAKTGFCHLSAEQSGLLQSYAYTHISDGFAFLKPFRDEQAELARIAFTEPLLAFRENTKKASTAGAIIDALLCYMKSLDVENTLQQQVHRLQEAGLFEEAAYHEVLYDKATDILVQAKSVLMGQKMNVMQLCKLLQTGFEAQNIDTIPPGTNEIAVGDISFVRLPSIKALFVLGANEGSLPDYSQSSDILADFERELILTNLAGLQLSGIIEKQRLAIIKAFARPSRKLFLSCIKDGSQRPSPILDRIKELFSEIRENDAAKLEMLLLENAYQAVGRYLRRAKEGEAPSEQERHLISAVFSAKRNDERLHLIKTAAHQDNSATHLNASLASTMFGEISGNASRLETYYACPYKHYLRYGVRPSVVREHTINQIDVGLYAHELLDGVVSEVRHAKKSWDCLSAEELSAYFERCRQSVRKKQEKFSINKQNETVLQAIDKEAMLVLNAIHKQAQEGFLQPAQTEYRFQEEFDGIFIDGVVDRIDQAEVDGQSYFSIIDYKTGSMEFDIRRAYSGLQMQLLLYILAVQKLMAGSEFAGALYFRIHLPAFSENPDLQKEYKMKGILAAQPEVAQQLFGGEGNDIYALSVKLTKTGGYNMQYKNQIYTKEDLQTLLLHVQKLIGRAVREIRIGNNALTPAGFKEESDIACNFCDYKSICLFDPGFSGNKKRIIQGLDKAAALQKMQEEQP